MSFYDESLTTKRTHLTEAEIRKVKEFENISDSQMKELRDTLYKLSIITYKIFSNE